MNYLCLVLLAAVLSACVSTERVEELESRASDFEHELARIQTRYDGLAKDLSRLRSDHASDDADERLDNLEKRVRETCATLDKFAGNSDWSSEVKEWIDDGKRGYALGFSFSLYEDLESRLRDTDSPLAAVYAALGALCN